MRIYTVINAIRHADAEQPLKDYAPGELIELSEVHAAPLLDSGDISWPAVDDAAKDDAPGESIKPSEAPAEPPIVSGDISTPTRNAAKSKK